MCAAAVPYKNGFRNFSYRRETTKLGGKRNTDAIITTPITADHHHQCGRESWVEFRGWIANSNRNQCFENRLWGWLFIEYFSWFVAVFCSHYCTKQFLICTNLKQCVKICYILRKLDKSRNLTHLTLFLSQNRHWKKLGQDSTPVTKCSNHNVTQKRTNVSKMFSVFKCSLTSDWKDFRV